MKDRKKESNRRMIDKEKSKVRQSLCTTTKAELKEE